MTSEFGSLNRLLTGEQRLNWGSELALENFFER